jgi:hypothetical protein
VPARQPGRTVSVCEALLILDRPVDDVDRALDADDKVDVAFGLFPLKILGERLDQRSPLLDQSPTGLPKDGDIALFQVASPYELSRRIQDVKPDAKLSYVSGLAREMTALTNGCDSRRPSDISAYEKAPHASRGAPRASGVIVGSLT